MNKKDGGWLAGRLTVLYDVNGIDVGDNETMSFNISVAESRSDDNSTEANFINAATEITIIYLVIGNRRFYSAS